MMQTIPDDVLDRIVAHRPHLTQMALNLRTYPQRAAQIEKAIADTYCSGETRLGVLETYHLSACCVGDKYGGGRRE